MTREQGATEDGEEPRRRRRRGGRGRGRGRGRTEDGFSSEDDQEPAPVERAAASGRPARPVEADEADDIVPAPRPRGANPFGSVWDSQLGTPTASTAPRAPITDDEDFDEPEIPEYLIAEQRRGENRGGGGGGGRGARGGRSAYQSAMERERYGRGGGGGGINRYPDVSARPRTGTAPRDDRGYGRGDRPAERPARVCAAELQRAVERRPARARGDAPGAGRPEARSGSWLGPSGAVVDVTPDDDLAIAETEAVAVEAAAAAPKTRGRKPAASKDAAAPKARAPRKTSAKAAATAEVAVTADEAAAAESAAAADAPVAKTAKPRATRKPAASKAATEAAPVDADASADGDAPVAAAPKRRSTRKAAPAETV